jgi:pimeloyl-ACP methyl ester carboxylesterase
MLFNESEQLLRLHPSLESVIRGVDERLSQFDVNGLANPSIFAALMAADPQQVALVFDELRKAGILDHVELCECPACRRLWPAADYKLSLASEDAFCCSDCGADLIQHPPRFTKEYRLSPPALHLAAMNRTKPKTQVSHLVLLIHGIRTDATWQEKVAAELNLLPGIEAQPIGYGVFDVFRFWFPFLRTLVLRKIANKIRHATVRHRDSGAKVSVIAHSFGTYSVFRLLNELGDFRFHRVILCGSIVSDNYPWQFVEPRVEEPIINDCGTRDIWPPAAKALSWGYGATGTFGFKSAGIRDRFHDIDHSGFFDDDFVRTYWVPFIERGDFVPSPWTARRPNCPYCVKFLAWFPVQWVTLGILIWWFKTPLWSLIQLAIKKITM